MSTTDVRSVRRLALASAIVLAAVAALWMFVPPRLAPRVHVRWIDGIADAARFDLERQFVLVRGEPRDNSTWTYDLVDPSRRNVDAIVKHPSVADTHYINRDRGTVWRSAPRGTTLMSDNPLSAWRDSKA